MNLNQLAQILEIDLPSAVARFAGNEALYVKFLKKFADDPTFSMLEKSVAEKNIEETEKNAHTLKGVAANLGLSALTRHCSLLVQAVRSGENDSAPSLFSACKQVYETTLQAIRQLD